MISDSPVHVPYFSGNGENKVNNPTIATKPNVRASTTSYGTSNLGEHVDRLLAKAVVVTAQQYGAGSIAVPKLDTIREILQAEIEAKAEQKAPGSVEGQKRYAKQYKSSIHKWSYGRLLDQVGSKASQAGLVIEAVKQPWQKTAGRWPRLLRSQPMNPDKQ